MGGGGRLIVTGVRWAESAKRKETRGIFEKISKNQKNRIILSSDNDDRRMLFENCKIKARRICNPIVDWEDRDVYEYIEDCKIQLNPLYECGWNRVGCIGCPLASKSRYAEFAMFPAYKRNYILAFERMLEVRKEKGKIDRWRSGMDVFHWWMEDGVIAGQVCMEHYEDR